MSSLRRNGSSSTSEGDQRYAMMDEKKRKRMISNRDSARRSRMKKQQLVQDLIAEVSKLQSENKAIEGKIDKMTAAYASYAGENNVLRAQATELTDRLKSLNDFLKGSGFPVDTPKLPDLLLKPWRLPYPMLLPITASSGLMQF